MHDRSRWVSDRGEIGVFRKASRIEHLVDRAFGQHCGTFPKLSNPVIVSKPKNTGPPQPTRSAPAAAFSIFTKFESW